MSVAIHPVELFGVAPRDKRRERQLAFAVAASLAVHGLALVVFPGVRRADVEPQRPLEVRIVPPVPKVEPPLRMKPPPPPPAARAPSPRPQPRPAPVQPATVPERKPVLALPENAAPATPAFTVPAPAPAAPAAPQAPVASAPAAAPPGPARESAAASAPVYNAAYLGNPAPRYPPMARRNGIEGTSLVRVLVSKDGRALQVALEKTSGSSVLDNAALEQAKTWKFAPARRGQEAVEQWVTMPFVYKLEGS
ncbi:MAG TPA: TonB family protein [Burkholderiales bacterium]|nr:TonB family protein [Burkholderiales bacterium]